MTTVYSKDWHIEGDKAWRINNHGEVETIHADTLRADLLIDRAWRARRSVAARDWAEINAHWRMHPESWDSLRRRLPDHTKVVGLLGIDVKTSTAIDPHELELVITA